MINRQCKLRIRFIDLLFNVNPTWRFSKERHGGDGKRPLTQNNTKDEWKIYGVYFKMVAFWVKPNMETFMRREYWLIMPFGSSATRVWRFYISALNVLPIPTHKGQLNIIFRTLPVSRDIMYYRAIVNGPGPYTKVVCKSSLIWPSILLWVDCFVQ